MEIVACSSLSKDEKRKSLSSQKKKKQTVKLILDSPLPHFKLTVPVIGSQHPFVEIFKRYLTMANSSSKDGTASQSRTFRKSLALGANEVTKGLRGGTILGVLLANDVKPQMLIAHVAVLCQRLRLPVVYLSEMRSITTTSIGFESIAVGFRNSPLCTELVEALRGLSPYAEETATAAVSLSHDEYTDVEVLSPQVTEAVVNPDGFIPLETNIEEQTIKTSARKAKKRKGKCDTSAESEDDEEVRVVKYKKDWVVDKAPRYFPPKVLRIGDYTIDELFGKI